MNPLLSPTFVIGYIRVDSIEGASALNIGNNWPTNFQSYKKHNQGFGTIKGNRNEIHGARTLLNDPDLLDAFGSVEQIPEWLQELLMNVEQGQFVDPSQSQDGGQSHHAYQPTQPNESPLADSRPAGGGKHE